MKKKSITYGVYGMMEYQSIIPMGKARLKVQFTDGSITSIGQNPAKFTTSDFMTQHAIENSNLYLRGFIKRINVIELDEEIDFDSGTNRKSVSTPMAEEGGETYAQGTSESSVGEVQNVSENEAGLINEEKKELTEVEFSTNQEAKDYLVRSFGVKGNVLKNRADIVSVGETFGVKINFIAE